MEQLLNIMRELREKCPWDQQQTPESLTGYAIEEAYEVEAAIREGDVDPARDRRIRGEVERGLEMAIVGLDRPVLVRLAGIAAAGEQTVMRAEVLVAPGDVLRRLGVEVAVGRGEAVGTMLARHAAEGPEGILEVLGQRREALAAKHDGGVLPAAVVIGR